MTLTAYAPNGLEIVAEFWLRPYSTPVTFERDPDVQEGFDEGYVADGVCALPDYAANEEHDLQYRMSPPDDDGSARELRWMDTEGNLWASEELTFKEEEE